MKYGNTEMMISVLLFFCKYVSVLFYKNTFHERQKYVITESCKAVNHYICLSVFTEIRLSIFYEIINNRKTDLRQYTYLSLQKYRRKYLSKLPFQIILLGRLYHLHAHEVAAPFKIPIVFIVSLSPACSRAATSPTGL